ncbi:hypothetical protein OEJ37_27335 [Burkholderia sp. BKH01]|uniref:hypothetical protein n=1 Tax=Burkholderia sp. BKH01 TaxID=2769262 RepID=UPI0021E0115D|nr:hypothetical protein [Burkholderia sp. BKH01]MCU9957080.1 hypothetical protein [Burkholderia sp. BKH01]
MSISVGMDGAGVSVGQTGIVDGRIIYRDLTICLKALLAMGAIAADDPLSSREVDLRMLRGNAELTLDHDAPGDPALQVLLLRLVDATNSGITLSRADRG